jgi:cell division protein FtsN
VLPQVPAPVVVDSIAVESAPATAAPVPATTPPLAASARAESIQVEAPGFGLEVASFIVKERAQSERKRLTAAGRKTRIETGWENGAAVYRVVVGPFPTTGDAERAADQMLTLGLVDQARVVAVKPLATRPR